MQADQIVSHLLGGGLFNARSIDVLADLAARVVMRLHLRACEFLTLDCAAQGDGFRQAWPADNYLRRRIASSDLLPQLPRSKRRCQHLHLEIERLKVATKLRRHWQTNMLQDVANAVTPVMLPAHLIDVSASHASQ